MVRFISLSFVLTVYTIFSRVQVYECICLSVSSEESCLGIDHAEEMELLLENYYMQVVLVI